MKNLRYFCLLLLALAAMTAAGQRPGFRASDLASLKPAETSAGGGISVVNQIVSSVTTSNLGSVTAGNLIVVAYGGLGGYASITDSLGNTYTPKVGKYSGYNAYSRILMTTNSTTSASCTLTSSVASSWMAFELSGATASHLVTSTNTEGITTLALPNLTSTVSPTWWISVHVTDFDRTFTAGPAGWAKPANSTSKTCWLTNYYTTTVTTNSAPVASSATPFSACMLVIE